METSVWELTAQERKNAAALIEYTTVRPFLFMGSSFKCFFCKEYNSDLTNIIEHTSTHIIGDRKAIFDKYMPRGKRTVQVDISQLNCRLCRQKFHNLNAIREHLVKDHGKDFFEATNGMTEYKIELVNGMFVCHICEKDFHSFKLLNSHMNVHVGKVVCETCGAGFLNQRFLMKHKDIHQEKKYVCKYCNKEFFKKSKWRYHTKIIHEGKNRDDIKKCPQCPQTFRHHYRKLVHLKEAHGISTSFTCYICKSSFNHRRGLTEHVNKFHTEKFKCNTCLTCFGTESRLKNHMTTHTGERKHICPVCKNTYMHWSTLKKHLKSHNQIVILVCDD